MGTDQPTLEGDVDEVELDEVFRALSNATRRRLLCLVAERGEPVGIEELVGARSAGGDTRGTPTDRADPDVASVELHHVHLPILTSVGLLEVDDERASVSPTPRLRSVLPLLEFANGEA